MINKKLILLLLFIIVLSSSTYADLNEGLTAYYSLENSTYLDNIGGRNFLNSSNFPDIVAGKHNNAIDLEDGDPDYLFAQNSTNGFPTSICSWSQSESSGGAYFGSIGSLSDSGDANVRYAWGHFGGQWWIGRRNGATVQNVVVGTDNTSMVHICVVFKSTNQAEMYLDGISILNTSTAITYNSQVDTFALGTFRSNSPAQNFDGVIDEVGVWNVALNSNNVSELYLAGTGSFYPFSVPPSVSFHNVKLINSWNGSNVDGINVTLNNSIYNITGSDGIASFSNLTGNFDFNTSSSDYFTIFGLAIENQTVIYNISQTEVNVSFEFSSSDLITLPINLTALDIGVNFNVTTGYEVLFPNAGFNNFSASSNIGVFESFNFTLNLSALDNSSFVFVVNETQNVITFLDENTSNPIDNATIIVTSPNGIVLNLSTNASGQINFSYILNGSLDFGVYSYFFDKLGYVNISLSDTINISNIPHTRTYNLSRAKLNIFIFDRVTRELLNGTNVSVAFIGLFNETTTTGTIVKDNLTIVGGDYLIYASADGYKTSIRSLTFTNQEEFTLNFYLLNLSVSNAGTLFVSTKDSFFRDITGAKVDLLEYVPSSLSYVSVDSCVSNVNAICSFAVELNTKVYYIRATSVIGDTVFVAETSQNGEIFTVDNDIRDLIFFTRSTFSISTSTNLIYDVSESFINNVSSIGVDFFTSDGTAKEVCVEYFIRNASEWVSVTGDTYCLFSSNAVQNIDVDVTLNRSNTYKADIYVKESFDNVLKTYNYPSIFSTGDIFDNDFKAIIIMILWIVALAFSMHQKNITLFFFLGIIISWGQVVLFPIFSMVSFSVFQTIVCLLSMYISRKKEDFQ